MKKFATMAVLAAGMIFAQQQKAPPKEAKDPVCGMTVDPRSADTQKSDYKGKTYYFCSREDKEKFDKSPDKYVAKADKDQKK